MFLAGVLSGATVPAPRLPHLPIIPIADYPKDTHIDSEELTQRNKLASLYRLVDLFRWSQGIYNHITVRISPDTDEILINAFGQLYNEVTASSLVKVDLEGNVLDKGSTEFGVNQAGYVLHSAIHSGRPDAKCVIHLHHPSVVAVSAQKCGLLPISQEAMIVGDVAYHEYKGILIDEAERALLIRDLGERNVMILRNHGFVVCAESVEHALSLTYHLIIACETQVKSVPGGCTDNVHFPSQAAVKQVYMVASHGGGGVNRENGQINSCRWRRGELEWQAYMRQLDAQGYVTGHENL
uniref:Aldolase_II domain-containing protein n=1 Tax=Caenorhabditis japonica TaxID=281687 RepID=A0A8R1HZQ0_CAEJA